MSYFRLNSVTCIKPETSPNLLLIIFRICSMVFSPSGKVADQERTVTSETQRNLVKTGIFFLEDLISQAMTATGSRNIDVEH